MERKDNDNNDDDDIDLLFDIYENKNAGKRKTNLRTLYSTLPAETNKLQNCQDQMLEYEFEDFRNIDADSQTVKPNIQLITELIRSNGNIVYTYDDAGVVFENNLTEKNYTNVGHSDRASTSTFKNKKLKKTSISNVIADNKREEINEITSVRTPSIPKHFESVGDDSPIYFNKKSNKKIRNAAILNLLDSSNPQYDNNSHKKLNTEPKNIDNQSLTLNNTHNVRENEPNLPKQYVPSPAINELYEKLKNRNEVTSSRKKTNSNQTIWDHLKKVIEKPE